MFLEDKELNYLIELMRGTAKKPPVLTRLAEWAKDRYGMEIYGYFLDVIRNGTLPRLRIVLWDKYAVSAVRDECGNYDAGIQKQFAERFIAIAKEEGVLPDYRNLDKLFVCFTNVDSDLKDRIFVEARAELKQLKQGDIQDILMCLGYISILYETDEQLLRHETDGKTEELKRICTEIVRKYDEFGVFKDSVPFRFSSRQTVDEQYEGNLYYFFN